MDLYEINVAAYSSIVTVAISIQMHLPKKVLVYTGRVIDISYDNGNTCASYEEFVGSLGFDLRNQFVQEATQYGALSVCGKAAVEWLEQNIIPLIKEGSKPIIFDATEFLPAVTKLLSK